MWEQHIFKKGQVKVDVVLRELTVVVESMSQWKSMELHV